MDRVCAGAYYKSSSKLRNWRKDIVHFKKVLTTLHHAKAKAIYTDGLENYKYLVTPKLHKVTRFGTNHIERNNLTLRTHLKRFNRRTICYSKSLIVLSAILKIYFWNRFV